jgi:uncharacterized protein (TIGR03437 family)
MFRKALLGISLLSAILLGPGQPALGQGGGNSEKGKGNSKGKGGKTIEWLTERSAVEQALLGAGTASVQFRSSADLTGIQVWLTPSLEGVTASPDSFATIVKDTTYMIVLTLAGDPSHTLAGTLHLRSSENDSRTYAPPFQVKARVKGAPAEPATEVTVAAVVAGANYSQGALAPGQIVSIFGKGIGPAVVQGLEIGANGRVATYLGDTQVLFNGILSPLLAVVDNQVNAVVPQDVAGDESVEVVVTHRDGVSAELTLPVAAAAPALFTLNGSGVGQAAALNLDGTINGPGNRARRGGVVSLFGTGFGEWAQGVPDGAVIGPELPTPKAPVSVTIGGAAARVLYAGGSPGLVSGVVALNVEIPENITPGDRVTVVVSVGGKSSPANVTVAVE